MRTIGLARATTKEIARAADCSEAALYKHFTGKEELFVPRPPRAAAPAQPAAGRAQFRPAHRVT